MNFASFGKSFKELRFIFCQRNERSAGMRNFIANNYLKIKDANPILPVVVRECEGVDPYIIIRYKFGFEKKAFTANVSEAEISDIVKTLVQQAEDVNKELHLSKKI